jgi:amicyanin
VVVRKLATASLPVAVLLALAAAGCGSASPGTTPVASSTGDPVGIVHVVMVSLDFAPTVVHVTVGQTVTWTNKDSSPHNVTYVSGPSFSSSPPRMNRGTSFSVRLTEPGTIHYYCSIHPWMKATIVVSQ